jgi:hypothetical protein
LFKFGCSSLKKKNLKNSKRPKNSIWPSIFLKNSWFFSSGYFAYVWFPTLSFCKKFVPSHQIKKWRLYPRWHRKCLYFSLNIFKNVIFVNFSLFILGKNKTFVGIFFLENWKWRNNLIWKMIFFKKFQDFIIAQPLNEMFSFFDML